MSTEIDEVLTAREVETSSRERRRKRRKKSRWGQLRSAYERLVASVIRPPRATYEVSDLGPKLSRRAGSVVMERTDFEVRNARNEVLACSLWRPTMTSTGDLVTYLHSNSSCRLAAVRSPVLEVAASAGCALLVFDFAACGRSEGDYVTLGLREADDVRDVLEFVVDEFFFSSCRVFFWGRSMGAVSALLYHHRFHDNTLRIKKKKSSSVVLLQKQQRRQQQLRRQQQQQKKAPPPLAPSRVDIVGLILDSPFSSIRQLVEDIRKRALPRTPRCCVGCVVCCLRRSAKRRTNADVMAVSAIDAAKHAKVPALFLAANADALAPPNTHTRFLAGVYGAPATLVDFDGEHNSPRPKHVYDAVLSFLIGRLNDHFDDGIDGDIDDLSEEDVKKKKKRVTDTLLLRDDDDDDDDDDGNADEPANILKKKKRPSAGATTGRNQPPPHKKTTADGFAPLPDH